MKGDLFLLLPVLLPVAGGLLTGLCPAFKNRAARCSLVLATLLLSAAAAVWAALGAGTSLVLFQLTRDIPVLLKIDDLARFFVILVSVMWTLVGIYSFEYMKHEKNEPRFYAFYLVTMGVLMGLCTAGNIVTLYMFYELMTLMTLPLVLHTMKKEAVAAGIKYLIYSVFGASAALLGIFFLNKYCGSLFFVAGGTLNSALVAGNEGTLLIILFLMILGFGTKAGMFPMHGWLPTAHPAAPAPASAVLSGVITKMGVLAIIRVVFYMVGADFLRGTWVQTAWTTLALITVFMGSMLALKENVLKKRLAYSTVSQVSYILFGLSTLTPVGFVGALLHVVFHSAIKNTLFMSAGAVISKTGKTEVSDLRGIGRQMPVVMTLFTIVSLGLIGIPPTGGFISKWYLATGALSTGGAYAWIGPAVLLVSAILTAAYLLTISIRGFFPGADFDVATLEKKEPTAVMWAPMLALALVTVVLGMFPGGLIAFFTKIATSLSLV